MLVVPKIQDMDFFCFLNDLHDELSCKQILFRQIMGDFVLERNEEDFGTRKLLYRITF